MGNQGKCQAIEDIELQDPKNMITFFAKDLFWYEIKWTNGSNDRVVKIMSDRVFDFIRGEEINPHSPCSFIRKKKRNG